MFIDKKIVLTQFTMMSFAMVSMLLSIFGKELVRVEEEILAIHSVITLGMLAMLCMRYCLK